MRPQIHKFINLCSTVLELPEPIVEIGSKRHPSQDKLANLRGMFFERTFLGCDMEAGPGVDRIENLEELSFADDEIGTLILCDTLEHVCDLDRAMKELERCLNSDFGVLIATSVMFFPVHGFPNDYWRFTPEGFRILAKKFECVYTFYGGDPNFPHSVAFIACRRELTPSRLNELTRSVEEMPPAPHYVDSRSERIFSNLGKLLVDQARSLEQNELLPVGEMGILSGEGWVLSLGSWIKIPLTQATTAKRLELRVNDCCVQVVDRENWNVLIHPGENGYPETAFQFEPSPDIPLQVTQLEVYLVTESGEEKLLARSGLGVIQPEADLSKSFTLHSVDKHSPMGVKIRPDYEHASKLIEEFRDRGEDIIVDLGCGFRKAGNIGIDATPDNTDADIVCQLGFDPLPFDDSVVDEIVCRDFLEHIPKFVYLESKGQLHYPVIYLMDEIWRVLKPGGFFRSWTPMYPHPETFQDPTHLSAWTIKSMDYFCGVYEGAKRIYGIQACFDKIDVREDGFYLYAELQKPTGT